MHRDPNVHMHAYNLTSAVSTCARPYMWRYKQLSISARGMQKLSTAMYVQCGLDSEGHTGCRALLTIFRTTGMSAEHLMLGQDSLSGVGHFSMVCRF